MGPGTGRWDNAPVTKFDMGPNPSGVNARYGDNSGILENDRFSRWVKK